MNAAVEIRGLEEEDYLACAKIYQEGLDTGIATFETQVPHWQAWDAKFLKQCRYVAEREGIILGWIALSPFAAREVYKGVAEVSLYVAHSSKGQGLGNVLLQYLIERSSGEGFWTLQAKIFPQNKKSLKLFAKRGFRQVGIRDKIGMRDGVWHDNVLMERRSAFE